ncbi:winged helix-turn-helix domain-containing protein (plasmid) [Serratia sp. L9]|uniref:winged helix-turn-helix domain-containing protein n=1 Tax=Serratia sp. L9 TaxID=3423946 RepID=UPI003D663E18
MLIRYVIDSSFEFCPESCQLTIFGAENITITLNIPASRCLELLLERRFKLVLQNDFYEYVWGDEAKSVSVNNLYQNIALLRKALKSISKKYQSMVLTVPKQGFKFNQAFSVQQLLGDEAPVNSVDNDFKIKNESDLPSLQEMLNESPTSSWWQETKTKLKEPRFYSVIVLALIIFLLHFISYWQKREYHHSIIILFTRMIPVAWPIPIRKLTILQKELQQFKH